MRIFSIGVGVGGRRGPEEDGLFLLMRLVEVAERARVSCDERRRVGRVVVVVVVRTARRQTWRRSMIFFFFWLKFGVWIRTVSLAIG